MNKAIPWVYVAGVTLLSRKEALVRRGAIALPFYFNKGNCNTCVPFQFDHTRLVAYAS